MSVRCPHCKAELPEQASFCAACGRRIEGWSVPKDATPASGEAALPGSDEATRQMSPTPSLLRAAALSVKKGGKPSSKPTPSGKPRAPRSPIPLVLGMVVVAVGGGLGAFFFVRSRVHHKPKPPVAVATTPSVPVPAPAPVPVPPQPVPAPPAVAKPTTLVRKSKTGKKAHVIASAPVPVKAHKQHLAPGALPHKEFATDSKPLPPSTPAPAKAPSTTAPAPMPTVQHETSESAAPATEGDQKQQAEATLDADSVRLVVRQHLPQVRACYSRSFKDSSPGGAVEIGFAIDPNGHAKNVRTETNTTDSEPLAHCLEQRVREWQFPRPVGGDYELIYPFVFAPGT
ncbi:MAG TPA: AgmX/PglI C-terminal domain-containing protein [Polyangia bacterium]|nr:AgmX/PglI C-terminal domain-containing protein [Polyangia bacterium]